MLVVSVAGVLVALYELAAVTTRRVPTITEAVRRAPVPARVAFIAALVAATIDHFGPGWVL